MSKWLLVLPFIVLAFLCWGVYGPVLHTGQEPMGHSSLRPFLCVGIAYFLVAVLVPAMLLRAEGEPGSWTLGAPSGRWPREPQELPVRWGSFSPFVSAANRFT